MSDLSYLKDNIPNSVVDSNYLVVNPSKASKVYLLGQLPNSKVFLINKITTSQRLDLTLSKSVKPGLIIYNTSVGKLEQYMYDTEWGEFTLPLPTPSEGTTGQALVTDGLVEFKLKTVDPITMPGDLIIGGADGTPIRLPVSTDTNPTLTVVSGLPAWIAGTTTPPA